MANIIDWQNKLRVNVRDQRGPKRTIVAVEWTPSANLVTGSCGHVTSGNATMAFKVGETHNCFPCLYSADNVISSEPLEPEIAERGY